MGAMCAYDALFSSTALGIMLLISVGLCRYNCGEYSAALKVDNVFVAAL